MSNYIEADTKSFGLPYGIQVEELQSPIIQQHDRREFNYTLRYFNRDYAWLGPSMLIQEMDFDILSSQTSGFPHRDTCSGRHRFWFYQPGEHKQYWKLLEMVAGFECLCLSADKAHYRVQVGKA